MASMRGRKSFVEWATLLLPAVIVGVGLVVSYVSLQKDVSASCRDFSEKIQRIETTGSTVAIANREQIAVLKAQFETINQRLMRMESNQSETLQILRRQAEESK